MGLKPSLYHFYFLDIAFIVIWCFQDEGQALERRMKSDSFHGFQAYFALTDLFVAVFLGAAVILTVVEVNGLESVEADDLIEFIQNPVQIIYDVIA